MTLSSRKYLAPWERATSFWGVTQLSAPRRSTRDIIAYIDLATRKTFLGLDTIAKLKLEPYLETIMTHEVGHHMRYPRELLLARQLQVFAREELATLVPTRRPAIAAGELDHVVNLFLDTLINDDMVTAAPTHREAMVAIYTQSVTGPVTTAFAFYLALYEALWFLPEGTLVTPGMVAQLTGVQPQWRDDAVALADHLAGDRVDLWEPLLRYLISFAPYLARRGPRGASSPQLDQLQGTLSDRERRSLAHTPRAAQRARERLDRPQARAGFPNQTRQDMLKQWLSPTDLVLAWYRRASSAFRVEVPGRQTSGDPEVPLAPEPWDLGDDLGAVDWWATLARQPVPIAGVNLLKRAWDEPEVGRAEGPAWFEIYVDSSGSMPNPMTAPNNQVIAGFVIARVAHASGGRVRVVQYSTRGRQRVMEGFSASPEPAYRALLAYLGGGTFFPWSVLKQSVAAHGGAERIHRIVISDADFLYNTLQGDAGHLASVADALTAAGPIYALLHGHFDQRQLSALRDRGVRPVVTPDRASLGDAAARLSHALTERR